MKLSKIIFSLCTALILTACADAEFGTLANKALNCEERGDCPKPPIVENNNVTENHKLGKTLGEVDILIVDDNSPSMRAEQRKMSDRFDSFISGLNGISWQIGITTTDVSGGSHGLKGSLSPIKDGAAGKKTITHLDANAEELFKRNVKRDESSCGFFNCPSSDEQPLRASIMAMEKARTNNLGFFRENANLAIVVLSDEDEKSSGGKNATKPEEVLNAFKANFSARKELSVYGIVIKPGDTDCFDEQKAGSNQVYYGTHVQALADATGGITGSICNADYSNTLKEISDRVGSTVRSIELSFDPIAQSVKLNVSPQQDFKWELSGRKIIFDRALEEGSEVEIKYERDSEAGTVN